MLPLVLQTRIYLSIYLPVALCLFYLSLRTSGTMRSLDRSPFLWGADFVGDQPETYGRYLLRERCFELIPHKGVVPETFRQAVW